MYEYILIRYGELSLKKGNRNQFVKDINNHITRRLAEYTRLQFQKNYMRLLIKLNGEDLNSVIKILQEIPGIHSISPVAVCGSDLDVIVAKVKELLKDVDLTKELIKVETNRANKNYPLTSLEITKEVSRRLFKSIPGLKADVHQPTLTINIDLRSESTYIYTKSIPGLGGLPSGSLGRALLLISGGIDSIVSGIEAVKRGIDVEAIHFASPPYTSDLALQKVADLLGVLAKYKHDGKVLLHVVPFTKIQDAIYQNVRNDYGITLMRRMMYRISERVATTQKDVVIINGENIGQVASQTLESISVINEVIKMPVIRPLATLDKADIIDKAIKYGTYDISIRPYEDCCTVFVPKHPQIYPRLDITKKLEEAFDYEVLIDEAIANIEHIIIKSGVKYQVIKTQEDLF